MDHSNASTRWEPVEASARYRILDLTRGFALFGVLMVNLVDFFRVSLFEHMLAFHSHAGWANHAVDFLVAGLLEFKAFTLFSLTFGIGTAIQADRAKVRGTRIEIFLLRRFVALFAFGIIHMVLVSNVDILTLYSVCGLLMIPFIRLPAGLLALAGLACLYLPQLPLGGPSLPGASVLREHAAAATRIYSQGTFGSILVFRWHETANLILPLLLGVAQRTFGLMLLGVAIWRSDIVRNPGSHRRFLWVFCIAMGIVGIANTAAGLSPGLNITPALSLLGSSAPVAFAYAAGLLLWDASRHSTAWLSPVAALGRMALTNYLAQSLVFALVFYGYGFGLFGQLAPATAALLGVAVYASQLASSVWWLRRYRFGPFEWLWRSLTYGRLQPMRVAA